VIDTAHGHTKPVIEMAKRMKAAFPNIDMIVGNIGTAKPPKTWQKPEQMQ